MLSRILAAAFILTACPLAAGAQTQTATPAPFRVAITVDDLTVHGALPPGVTHVQVGDAFIAAFKAHQVPEAWGFINGVQLEREPASEGVLTAWRAAGYPLGNHGYTHMNAGQNTIEAFKTELDGNEPLLARYMGDTDWRWLRFPFLSAGNADNHAEVMAYVAQKGYRVADVTISFNDWAYADPYARCVVQGNTAAIADMRARYLSDTTASIRRARALSQKIYGRDIPHVMLIHVGAFTGEMLPQVLEIFKAEGAQFVTLAEAQSDPAYVLSGPNAAQGMMLERVAGEKGIDISGSDIAALSDINIVSQMCR